jgi:hypothetical protein
MVTSYAEREIALTIQLGKGSFGDAGADTVTFRDHRIFVEIELATQAPPIALIRVYGLSLSRVNQLTRAGLNWESSNNSVLVEAGDANGQLKAIFEGQIFIAEPDFNSMPDTSLVITANGGRAAQMKPVPPNSFKGGVSAQTVLGKIAQAAGFKLENNGVQTMLDSPYFYGAAWRQLDDAAQAANCFFYLDTVKKVVAVWPKAGSRAGDPVLVAPETGAIGYPAFSQTAIKVRTLFDPRIEVGKPIEVRSQLTAASGKWSVVLAGHTLESQTPGGPWETHATAYRAGAG